MLSCITCKQEFEHSEKTLELCQKIGIPQSNECFECRTAHKLAFRNERTLYPGICKLCEKSIITLYHPESSIITYCQECWWSDKWDPLEFGLALDLNRPFFEQYQELLHRVPHIAMMNRDGDNSEYCNYTLKNKNCYLIFGGDYNENCYYGTFPFHSRETMESYWLERCERCYEILDCEDCYSVIHARYCKGCSESWFVYDCRDCQNCFGCIGLRSKQYHMFNKPYSKEEYEKKIANYKLGTRTGFARARAEAEGFIKIQPHAFARILKSQDVTGDDIQGCSNLENCYDCSEACEHIAHSMFGAGKSVDCVDSVMMVESSSLIGNSMGIPGGYHIIGGNICWFDREVSYSHFVVTSENCFGCISLNKKQYCILNKQYSKEEYEELVGKLVNQLKTADQWGRYFPRKLAPFGYNESAAMDYFPLERGVALARGYRWQDNPPSTTGKETLPQSAIPDAIADVDDSLTKEILSCDVCQKNYKVIAGELKLYKSLGLPIPSLCPLCRHFNRMKRRNTRRLYYRQCMCDRAGHDHASHCPVEFETTYAPDRPEIIYCESCYQKEIV